MGSRCLLVTLVSGNMRLPVPPARITPFIISSNPISPSCRGDLTVNTPALQPALCGTPAAICLICQCTCAYGKLVLPMRRILLVDDSPMAREPLARLLAYEGYEVLAAANGLEAIETLRD